MGLEDDRTHASRTCHHFVGGIAKPKPRRPNILVLPRRHGDRHTGRLFQARIRGAAVALSPVFGVPVGSISRMWTSPRATGRCSTPLGHDKYLTGAEGNRATRNSMSSVPLRTRKKSSVSSCVPVERPFKLGHHDVVIVVSGNSAGREAVGERSELFAEIGWYFHHFPVHLLQNERGSGQWHPEYHTHATDLLAPPAQIRPPILF
jgi:hypothetical protein